MILELSEVGDGPWLTKKQAVHRETGVIRRASGSGIKAYGGERVIPGNIIARQRGTTWHPGLNVGMGTDHTLFAKIEGRVEFRAKANGRTFVSVVPMAEAAE